jgi:DNA-binding response OmpR family regulator
MPFADHVMQSVAQNIQAMFQSAKVLIVDDEPYTRKVLRTLLTAIGVDNIHDADDGMTGLDAIREVMPDVVLLDWEMPGLDGPGFVKVVRSGEFPNPNVPIIMLTGHGERWRVVEAIRLGVNDYLLKPVSSKTLLDRMVSGLTRPRPVSKAQNGQGSQPRAISSQKTESHPPSSQVTLFI